MIIKFGNTELDLILDTTSYRYRSIMGDHSLNLYFSSPEYVDIPVGAYCTYQGVRFTLIDPQNFKKNSEREYSYTLIMHDYSANLDKYRVRDISSKRVKFPLTAKPKEHLQMIVDNLNMRESGWSVGECIETDEKTIAYNHISLKSGLRTIADTFNTEWEIDSQTKTIHLRKVEYDKNNPLPLSYGKGNGFKPGLGRTNLDNSKPITLLLVQGGEKNIDPSKYGSKELLLPKSQSLQYEGRTYVTDAEGTYITRGDIPLSNIEEDSLDCSNIFPKRVGSVSEVLVPDEKKNFYDFIDNTIPEDLDFEECLIEGEQMTVIFQSGMLAGSDKSFEVKYIHKERKFQIVPQEIDGVMMPNEVYKPVIGDKYAVFGIQMPEAYICDNKTKTGASWDMFRESAKHLYENEDQKFTFKGELDGIWSKKRWLSIGGKIRLGGYVLFTDPHFQPDGIKIRIVGVKDYIHNPYSPQIELSNITVGSSVSTELDKIEENEVITDKLFGESIQFTKRRFRDAKETLEMLNNALLHFSGSISPISVQTMSLLVGDESLQYRFVNNKTNPTQVAHIITYNIEKKQLVVPSGIIQHMTMGIKSVSSTHKVSEYKFWDMGAYTSPVLTDADSGYYLYARVNISGTTGSFLLSKTAIKMEGVSGYYHLLVGILNSEFEGERSFVELYGFTEILPGRITTDRVVSSDGLNFLDFINNAFRVGNNQNYIDFNSQKDGKLRLKGSIIQSESGDESPVGCFRGAYNASYTYYWGDEVVFTDGTGYSMYRFTSKDPAKGISPQNGSYWTIVAQRGVGISDTDVLYAISSSNTTAPSTGWQTTAPAWKDGYYIWSKTKVVYTDGSIVYTDAACITGGKGETGNGISSITEQYYLSSSATSLSGGSWSTTRPTWKNGWYIWTRSVIYYTNGNSITTDAICATGSKGDTGNNGDYFEYRFAVNGSRTTPPALSTTSRSPSGWTTSVPTVGSLKYLWLTIAKISGANNTLLQSWSTPVRQTPYDGVDGKIGATMVYRGIYSSSKVYYGTEKRVDAVKYNGHYYVARVDGGNGFQNHAPTDTAYWNDFGAEFESIATNLLLAEGANIGDWFMSGGKIVSTLLDGNKITLDASMSRILIESSRSGGDYSESSNQGATIKLDASNGLIEARSKTNSRVAYMSPTGIFCNNAETQAVSAVLGVTHKAAIVGLGFGTVNKSQWDNENFIAGVYGRASNSGTAPAYGGFFQNLLAAGLILHVKAIEETSSYIYLSENDSIAVGYSRNNQNVYLPTDGIIGRVVFVRQWWSGEITLMSRGGQKMYYNNNVVNSFKIVSGETAMCIFCIGYIAGVKTEAWIVNSFKTGA